MLKNPTENNKKTLADDQAERCKAYNQKEEKKVGKNKD